MVGCIAKVDEVFELRRADRDVIDDEVGHDLAISAECGDIAPGAQPVVHFEMVFWVKPGVRPIKGSVKREQMNAREDAVKWSL